MANSVTYLGETYTDEEIVSGSFSKHQSLSMSELSVDTMEITIRPNHPFAGQFQQNTQLVQYVDGSQIAIWYLQSIERLGANVYKLNGFSSLGRLTQLTHYGGIYDGTQTVADVVDEIMGDLPYYISPEFENIALYGWLPIATARDNLQQVLFAVNAALQTNAQGVLCIKNLPTAAQVSITQSDIFQSGASVKYGTPVTKVVVVEHQYFVGSGTKELFNGTATGNQLISFDEPMSNLQSSGLTIVSSGANYAIVNGTGALTGTPYVHTMREIERAVTTTATVENIVRVENATLVGLTASSNVVHRLADYYACRNAINVAVAQAFIGSGAIASVFDPYDMVMRSACIDSVQVSLSHTPKSTISALVGYTPWQTVPFDDYRELLTGSGTWTVPAGVTEATVVLIGGGSGGTSGANGQRVVVTSRTYTNATSGNFSGKSAGEGGAGGNGGSGGNIFRAEIDVTPGSSFSFSCGAGGAASTAGTDTVFGTRTSGDGAPIDSGFVDPITGTIYGAKGENGGTGGNGGSTGKAGESVGSHSGGSGRGSRSISDDLLNNRASGSASFSGYGGGGAGAPGGNAPATGANGTAGSAGDYFIAGGISSEGGQIYILSMNQTVFLMAGGDGGDGGQGADATVYGCGGGGGGGGGGAGATGNVSCSASPASGVILSASGNSLTVDNSSGAWSEGGRGGSGGAGAPGCIIIYYRRPAPNSGTT